MAVIHRAHHAAHCNSKHEAHIHRQPTLSQARIAWVQRQYAAERQAAPTVAWISCQTGHLHGFEAPVCRTRHFCLVLDAIQKLLGEASGARLDEAEKLLSPLQKLAHQDEHQAKVRGPCSRSGPASCALLTAASPANYGLAGQMTSVLELCSFNMVA